MRNMKLVARLRLLFAVMLLVGLAGAGLSLWSVRQTQHHIQRINLAHSVYDGYLSLSSHTFQLFKQYGDDMIIGDRDRGFGKAVLIDEIRRDITRIRGLIGTEIDLVGEEEIEELEWLALIEIKLEELIAALERVSTQSPPGELAASWWELSQVLDDDIDRDFRAMIDAALAEEIEEVEATKAEVGRRLLLLEGLALGFAGVAVAAGFGSMWAMGGLIRRPVERLLDGARRFGEADFGHRIALEGRDELAEIGATIDMMAERVGEKTQTLTLKNEELDRAVRTRTEQLERLLAAARQADRNRRQMLADVSHELRTPLTIIQGEADITLRGGDKPPEVYREALARTRDAASHTARLIDDLLFVARNEAGETRMVVGDVDLVQLLPEAAKGFEGVLDLEGTVDCAVVRGDAERLRQAVVVLLDNARRHGGKHIVARVDHAPNGFRVAVEDDGPGMSDDEKASAFERYFRGSNASDRYAEGVGLGLPIARAVVEAHGGEVSLEDREGGGLIATIFLPKQPRLRVVS